VDVDGSEPGTWNADDGSYHSSTEPDSEEILSDAEVMGAEDCDITQAQNLIESITKQLKEQGWDEERIGAWMLADCDMLKAMKKMQAGVMAAYELEVDQGNAPSVLIMFDGGTFAHMWGTDLVASGCITNIRKVPRVPCRTARGIMWLDTKGDAVFNGMTLKGGFINPNNSTSLISEGMLMLFESWDFHKNLEIGFTFSWPGLDKPKTAWRQGVLYYVPADMIPHRECSAVCSVDADLPNDIDQSELNYDLARADYYDMDDEGYDLGPLLFDSDRSPSEQLYHNEDFYDAPAEDGCCEQDTWMQLSAQDAFAAFTVANIDEAGDMDIDCGGCENMGQDFRRGLERSC
jgi:hypothetical protein